MRKWCKKIEIEILDKWLISLDHVTYVTHSHRESTNLPFVLHVISMGAELVGGVSPSDFDLNSGPGRVMI